MSTLGLGAQISAATDSGNSQLLLVSTIVMAMLVVCVNRLHFGEEVVIAVEVAPACLHHADGGIGEVVNGAREEVRGGDEVGVEDGDHFTGGGLQPFRSEE